MFLRIGHRGAAGYEPENTLLSFKKALKLKVDLVELDAQICKTGQVVVIHDAKIDRTTKETGFVTQKTFQELRALDVGKGQRIPTLQEVLDVLDRKIRVNIEIKGSDAAKPVFDIMQTYVSQKGWSWDDFLVSSFNHYELLEFNRLTSKVKVGAVIAGVPIGYAECATRVNAYSLHPSKEFINQALVDDAHKRGMKVFAYTPNDMDFIQKVKSLGVDGLFSDFPDRL